MRTVPLGDVIDVDRGIASEDECRTMPYVGLEHIEKECGRFSEDFRPKPEQVLATKFRFTPDHVLYGKLRPYLNKVALPHFRGVCTTEILPLLPKRGKLERGFLYAVLLSPRFVSWASQNVSGANLPRLGPDRLLEYELSLPNLAEQKHIAVILERADRLRRLRRYGLEMAETIVKSIFRDMFGESKGRTDFTPVELDDVAEVQGGITLSSRRQELALRKPYLRVANVQSGMLMLNEVKSIGVTEAEFQKTRLQRGDLLLVEGNGNPNEVGRGAIWEEVIPDCVHQNHLIRVRCNADKILPGFLLNLINGLHGRDYFLRASKTTSGLFTISTSVVNSMPIVLPPIALQRRFENVAKRHAGLTATHRESLREAEHLFQALLQRAFRSGV